MYSSVIRKMWFECPHNPILRQFMFLFKKLQVDYKKSKHKDILLVIVSGPKEHITITFPSLFPNRPQFWITREGQAIGRPKEKVVEFKEGMDLVGAIFGDEKTFQKFVEFAKITEMKPVVE
jgi:hypothetical protein